MAKAVLVASSSSYMTPNTHISDLMQFLQATVAVGISGFSLGLALTDAAAARRANATKPDTFMTPCAAMRTSQVSKRNAFR